ncbi:hypothetical protein H8E77_41470, partial [bacterium]|nr:hypothetical protein [bacterium]
MIQTPPNLIASLNAEHPGNTKPNQISEGQNITVTMMVQNAGEATAKNVKPSDLKVAGNAALALPPSPSEYDISSGESRTFTWIYNTAMGSDGSITFSGCASGTDFNSGDSIKTSDMISNPMTIQTSAHLEVTSLRVENPNNPIKTQISGGQSITLTMVVKNSGVATAKDVYVDTPSWPGSGTATLINPKPEKVTIAGGREQTFEWSWITTSDNAAENLVFDASVTGTDFNFN